MLLKCKRPIHVGLIPNGQLADISGYSCGGNKMELASTFEV